MLLSNFELKLKVCDKSGADTDDNLSVMLRDDYGRRCMKKNFNKRKLNTNKAYSYHLTCDNEDEGVRTVQTISFHKSGYAVADQFCISDIRVYIPDEKSKLQYTVGNLKNFWLKNTNKWTEQLPLGTKYINTRQTPVHNGVCIVKKF